MKKNDTKLKLYTKNNKVKTYLNMLNNSIITKALLLLGDFEDKVEVNIYDYSIENEHEEITLYLFDNYDNLFIFCPKSTSKKELLLIRESNNGDIQQYNLSLFKNYELTKENISLGKYKKKYDTKFGRLITDSKSFYSLFLASDSIISKDNVIYEINSFNNIPTFMDFKYVFEKLLINNNYSFDQINLSAFKNFTRIGDITIDNTIVQELESNNKIKTKNS